jgi:hypothetical protein
VFWRGRRDGREPGELALGLTACLLRDVRLLDLPAQVGELRLPVLAELALDRLKLLAQVEIALCLLQPLRGVARDLLAQLADCDLVLEQLEEPAQLGADRIELLHLRRRLLRRSAWVWPAVSCRCYASAVVATPSRPCPAPRTPWADRPA